MFRFTELMLDNLRYHVQDLVSTIVQIFEALPLQIFDAMLYKAEP